MINYNINKNNDTIVVICYFCTKRYRTKISNLYKVIDSLKKANIPYYLIELLFKDQCNVFDANQTVKSNSFMFYKENLYNIAEKAIPDNYKKILFMDADVWYTNPDWFNRCSVLLDSFQVIQPMEYCVWNENIKNRKIISNAANLCNEKKAEKSHPGFAIGIDRKFFNKIGGFYDKAFVGGGDRIFWESLFPSNNFAENMKKKFHYYHDIKELDYKPSVSFLVECDAVHMPHGNIKHRKYQNRIETYLEKPINEEDFYKNEYNVYEWKNKKNSELILDYFLSRDEDRYLELPFDFNWEFYIMCNRNRIPDNIDNKETAEQHYVDHGRIYNLEYKKI